MARQITPEKAAKLCDNYDAKHHSNKNSLGVEDNRSCLYSIQEIKDYISYLENSNQNIDGIRIYIGAYSDNEKDSLNNNMTTVFLAPTSRGVDNTILNALNLGNGGHPPKKKYGNKN